MPWSSPAAEARAARRSHPRDTRAALGVAVDAVSVKGKTNEGMGEIGPRRRHGRPRGGAAGGALNAIRHSSSIIRQCGCASLQAPPGTCMSATPARRCSTGCSRADSGGTFVLRIEDTDRERSTLESEQYDPRRLALAGARLGRGTRRRRRPWPVPPVRAARHLSGARRSTARETATPTTASARRNSSRPIGRPRSPPACRRATRARCRAIDPATGARAPCRPRVSRGHPLPCA